MSTFDGIIREFPGIRVDFFRGVNDDPPLACFLSHIHSDHLAGLETYKGRPIYCSAATRAMLLKLQRRASRINFAQGMLEKQEITYKNQSRRLKALPLNTPTDIELAPNKTIRVTLLDANHCPGAVMFLFEGNGMAVLYTGDIRSEPFHVDTIIRNPCMVEYLHQQGRSRLKTLNRVYLDTSFTEDVHFQTKSDGLHELLEKVSKYPKDTVFYFSAWTYGYEEVWIALAKALDTKIHVDDYKLKVYESLRVNVGGDDYMHLSPEAPALTGFTSGNRFHPGCLTREPTARIHSCEKGSGCPMMNALPTSDVVWIMPVVAHLPNKNDMVEVGIGGGADDLEERDELLLSPDDLGEWVRRVNQHETLAEEVKDTVQTFLRSAISAQRPIMLPLVDVEGKKCQDDLDIVFQSLVRFSQRGRGCEPQGTLPNRIKFPYSRHSSYRELCDLVSILRPMDIWPCTVDPMRWMRKGFTIRGLFGEYCSGDTFQHDQRMAVLAKSSEFEEHSESQRTTDSLIYSSLALGYSSPLPNRDSNAGPQIQREGPSQATTASDDNAVGGNGDKSQQNNEACQHQQFIDLTLDSSDTSQIAILQQRLSIPRKRNFEDFHEEESHARTSTEGTGSEKGSTGEDDRHLLNSQASSISARALEARRNAFDAVLQSSDSGGWVGLLSTTDNHTYPESELGEG